MSASEISTKPYLLRALYEWCVDNGYTPHLAVKVDSRVQVPQEFVKNGEITLNVSPTAVHKLQMGNEVIEFSARFAGVARQISVPVTSVYAVYARETGHGMTFEVDTPHGRMMATMLAGIAQFERDMLSERVRSGLAAARARGRKLGRQTGVRPKSDRLAPKVLALVAEGRSYRWIARDLGLSKNTVAAIVGRSRADMDHKVEVAA